MILALDGPTGRFWQLVVAGRAGWFRSMISHDSERRELRAGGTIVPIEPQVFDLSVYLIENSRSRGQQGRSHWFGSGAVASFSDSTLDSRINGVRKALGDSGKEQRLIRTVARKGVRLPGEVTASKSEEALGPARAIPRAGSSLLHRVRWRPDRLRHGRTRSAFGQGR